MTLFQDISSKKKEEISFFIGKNVDFSMNAHFFVSCCTKELCKFTIIKKIVNNWERFRNKSML